MHQSAVGIAAGIGGLTGVLGDLADGRFQLAQCIADQRGIPGLAFGAAVQTAAEVGQSAAGAGDLFGMAANAGDQFHQITTQMIERVFDVAQLAGA